MSRTDDLTGTSNRSFQLGVRNDDSDISLRFKGKGNGDLKWNPQVDRTIRFPDKDGTVQLVEDGYGVGAYAYRSTSLSIPVGGAAVFFNNTRWNSNSIYLPVQSSRLTAPFTGVYDVGGAIVFAGVSLVSNRELKLRINGSTTIALDNRQSVLSTATSLSVQTQWKLNAGDYVELVAGHGSLISLDLAIGEVQPNLWMSLRQKG